MAPTSGSPGRDNFSLSTQAYILPFIEQTATYNLVNFSATWNAASNVAACAVYIPIFVCPADPCANVPPNWAPNSYRANQGTSILWGNTVTTAGTTNFGVPGPNGPFYLNSIVRIQDITDGTSNTACFSEHLTGDFNNAVATANSDTFEPGTHPQTVAQAWSDCQSMNINNPPTDQGYSDVGAPWLFGYHSTTIYFHSFPPNTLSCMYPPGIIATTANSKHDGGVNLLLCDGSVRFTTYAVSLATWQGLGTIAGSEVLGDDY